MHSDRRGFLASVAALLTIPVTWLRPRRPAIQNGDVDDYVRAIEAFNRQGAKCGDKNLVVARLFCGLPAHHQGSHARTKGDIHFWWDDGSTYSCDLRLMERLRPNG